MLGCRGKILNEILIIRDQNRQVFILYPADNPYQISIIPQVVTFFLNLLKGSTLEHFQRFYTRIGVYVYVICKFTKKKKKATPPFFFITSGYNRSVNITFYILL